MDWVNMFGPMGEVILDFGKEENNMDWENILMKIIVKNSECGFAEKEIDGLMRLN